VDLINAMTRETLAFARGDTQVWVRKVYLHKFFADVASQLRRELEGRKVELALDVRDRGIARFDQHKIQRAIHNLVRNGAEAIGERGGTITVGVDRRSDDGAIVITIADDGPGLPDEMRERLFESFATHGKPHGTGLGLAIVRKVVDDHGGTIEFQSQPGHTQFTMTLPQIGLDTQTERPPPPSADEGGPGPLGPDGRPSWIG
jgi:signal transduction histidine kinase